jgi:hypothetical protein
MDNMVKLIAKMSALEEQAADIEAQKMPIFDEIQELREVMVRECIHPLQYLVEHEDHILCKFCNTKIAPAVDG